MTDEEYLEKYQKEYGILDEEGKKHILKYRNFLTEEELEKDINEWIDLDDKVQSNLIEVKK